MGLTAPADSFCEGFFTMTPIPPNAAPWWQTLVASVVNLVIAAVVQHYFGNLAAAATVASGTAIAHALPSPGQQK